MSRGLVLLNDDKWGDVEQAVGAAACDRKCHLEQGDYAQHAEYDGATRFGFCMAAPRVTATRNGGCLLYQQAIMHAFMITKRTYTQYVCAVA
jgi:hypothetical protein